MPLVETTLDNWLQVRPAFAGSPQQDSQALASYVQTGELFLRSLGPKAGRADRDRQAAAAIHGQCRELRRRFMALHAAWLYRVLTDNLASRKTLAELAYAAAACCPGLTPTAAQIEAERSHRQSDKEGHEIDQGILFHGWFRVQEVGTHIVETALMPTRRAVAALEQFRGNRAMDLGCVAVERRGDAAYVTMNNGDCLNAEDDRFVEDMETAVDLVLMDESVRVGVMRGGVMTHPRYAGRRVFCAGINLKALHGGQISFIEFLLRRELGYLNKIVRGLWGADELFGAARRASCDYAKPWIGCVDAFAIGGGAQVLLVLDRVVAASDAYFSLPAAREGIVPGFANLRLGRSLSRRAAMQVILCGRRIDALEADGRLVFDEVIAPSEMDAAIESNVRRLAAPAVRANRHMLNIAEEPLDTFLRYAAEFALIQAERLYSDDVLDHVLPVHKSET